MDIYKNHKKVEKEIQRLSLEKNEERLSNQVIDELYKKMEDKDEYQNTELLVLLIFTAVPIRIPFCVQFGTLPLSIGKKADK